MINPSKLYFGIEGSCSTRYQSGTEIRYPSLTIDPSRSLKCISPQTVPHTARPFTQSVAQPNCVPSREAICTKYMMVFGVTRPGS